MLTKSTRPDPGAVEARGEFWDLGRLQQEDPRFAGYDMDRFIERVSQERWPGQNQVFILALDLAGPGTAAPPRRRRRSARSRSSPTAARVTRSR